MAPTLRVDPERLEAAAGAQADVGAYVAGMDAGRPLAGVAQAMAGLESGAAGQAVGMVLDEVAHQVSADLTAHSERLIAAADCYRAADQASARRLRRIAD